MTSDNKEKGIFHATEEKNAKTSIIKSRPKKMSYECIRRYQSKCRKELGVSLRIA